MSPPTVLTMFLSLVAPSSYVLPPTSQPDESLAKDSAIFKNHLIFVPASINGRAAVWALLDTGASACAIDAQLSDSLKLKSSGPTTVHGTTGAIQAQAIEIKRLSVFGKETRNLYATSYGLSALAPDGKPVGLILGYPVLKQFAVEVDYAKKRIVFHDQPVTSERSMPMRLDNGIPVIRGVLQGSIEVEFRIDTGASLFDSTDTFLNITSSVEKKLRAAGFKEKPAFRLQGSGVGGPVDLPVIRLESVRLGLITIDRPYAIVQPPVGIFADPAMPGFVGNYTLKSLGRVVFDYLDLTLDVLDPN